MRTIEIKVYEISEHPQKENAFRWIRENWHDLNDHGLAEVVESLLAMQRIIGGELDYSISTVQDRSEYIRFTNFSKIALSKLVADDYELTGVCYDFDVIKGLQEGDQERVLKTLHEDTSYIYSNEGLIEMCEANKYEFKLNGQVI